MEAYMGTILPWAVPYAPAGWLFCQGQSLLITQYSALFALLGITYGGDGSKTFNLPDLRSRVPLGAGQGTGLGAYQPGQQGGTENVTLSTQQIPAHSHQITANNSYADTDNPTNAFIAQTYDTNQAATIPSFGSSSSTPVTLNNGSVQIVGGGQPHTNLQPYLVVNYIICYQGIYPTRA